MSLGFRVQGLGFRKWDLGFRVFRVQGTGLWLQRVDCPLLYKVILLRRYWRFVGRFGDEGLPLRI